MMSHSSTSAEQTSVYSSLFEAIIDPDITREELGYEICDNNWDVNQKDQRTGYKPIMVAAMKGSLSSLQCLIEDFNANLDIHFDLDENAEPDKNLIHYCLKKPEFITYLINPNHCHYKNFKDEMTELDISAILGDWDATEQLINSDPALIFTKIGVSQGFLYWAMLTNQLKVVESFFEHASFWDCSDENRVQFMRDAAYGAFIRADKISYSQEVSDVKIAELFFQKSADLYLKAMMCDDSEDLAWVQLALGKVLACRLSLYTRYIRERRFGEAYDILNKARDTYYQYPPSIRPENQICEIREILENLRKSLKFEKHFSKWGFTALETPADGSCFFHAVADQLIRLDNRDLGSDAVSRLRKRSVDYIAHNLSLFWEFFANPDDFEKHMDDMRLASNWVEQEQIMAVIMDQKITIVIFDPRNTTPRIFKSPQSTGIIYLAYDGGTHYMSAVNNREATELGLHDIIESEPSVELSGVVDLPIEVVEVQEVEQHLKRRPFFIESTNAGRIEEGEELEASPTENYGVKDDMKRSYSYR